MTTLLLGLLLVTSLALVAVESNAQCTTSITNSGTVTMTATPYYFITKTLGGTFNCQLTATNNVLNCQPGPTIGVSSSVSYVYATAATAATNPSCAWNCGCGAVTIDTNDGLPVELMDFSVE